ncbi:ribosomal protein S18-alanine N-acetyltransferase [Psychromonas algicola]|uniref:ribosomal protein S18-alanine N-acetyltransferase n=1 Tax=Psychromonas algicola TaxID=2555642 RepID=UPI001FBBA9EA|nr:ribosomal protein S18-alanine N-acetyltransferase [Psychromonas sp. RZ5]
MPINNNLLNPSIIAMAVTDIPAVLTIECAAHSHPWSEKLFLSNFGKRYINHILIIEDEIIGYFIASYVAGEVTLLNIAIAPKYQGKGLGQKLLTYLIQFSHKLEQQEIWLEVRASNQSAIAIYQKLDFVEVDIRPAYYPAENGREDAIVMCCYIQ